jgi:hypothetical protein
MESLADFSRDEGLFAPKVSAAHSYTYVWAANIKRIRAAGGQHTFNSITSYDACRRTVNGADIPGSK